MDTLYLLVKFVHVVAVVIWLGGRLALAVVTARLARADDAATLIAVRRQSQGFGHVVVGPAAGVTMRAGLGMVGRVGFGVATVWVVWGMIAIIASIVLGAVPIRRAGAALDDLAAANAGDPRFAAFQRRLTLLSLVPRQSGDLALGRLGHGLQTDGVITPSGGTS